MLILVAVTINFVINGGIINRAKEAAEQTQLEADKESLYLSAISCIGPNGNILFTGSNGLDNNLPSGFIGTNGVYTKGKYTFTVDEQTGHVTVGNSQNSEEENQNVEADLRKYIMGIDNEGRTISEFLTLDEGAFSLVFIDDLESIPDEYKSIKSNLGDLVLLHSMQISAESYATEENGAFDSYNFNNTYEFYFSCNEKKYKFTVTDEDNNDVLQAKTTSLIELTYGNETKANETVKIGDTVWFDDKKWVIMYNDTARGIQMISEEALSSIPLGKNDSTVVTTEYIEGISDSNHVNKEDLLKEITSYNNAIDTLNSVCENLVNIPNTMAQKGMTVRCVGTNPIDPTDPKGNNDKYVRGYYRGCTRI